MSSKDGRRKTKHSPFVVFISKAVTLIFGVGFGFGLPVFVLTQDAFSRDNMVKDPIGVILVMILLLMVVAMGCGAIWFSLFLKNRTPAEQEQVRQKLLQSADAPEMSGDTLFYSFEKLNKSGVGAVYVDPASRMLHFCNCHTHRGFWNVFASRWFSCAVDELRAAYAFKPPRTRRSDESHESLTVVTTGGKATIPGTAIGYRRMRAIIKEFKPVADPETATEHPGMLFALIGGAFIGFMFVYGTFDLRTTSDLYYVVGAVLGAVIAWLLVRFGGHFLKINVSEKKKQKSGHRKTPDYTFHADHQLNMGIYQDTTAGDDSGRNDVKSDRGKADA